MTFSLPYSKKKRYLTGIDWVVGAMDHDARIAGGSGAISQAVLDIQGHIESAALQDAIEKVSQRFPLIHGRVARDWLNLAPYWKYPRQSPASALQLTTLTLDEHQNEEAHEALVAHANTPLAHDREHLRFLLIHQGPSRTHLGMVFDHRLLDAFGAEAFLHLINLAWQDQLETVAAHVKVTEPAQLDHWPRRFKSGKVLTGLFHEMKNRTVAALQMPAQGRPRKVKFMHDQLTQEQSQAFSKIASQEIRAPIILPAAAARAMDAMRQTFPTFPLTGEHLLLFTSVTQRQPGREMESLFFNPFAFLGFWADFKPALKIRELANAFRDQLFEYMKLNVPAAMMDASALGRIFPLSLVSRISKDIGGGRLCSLYFACLRETGYPNTTFMGKPIHNLVHTPLAFCPPGLNLCMTWHNNHFNLVLAYVENTMSDAQATQMLATFKASLLTEAQ